MHNWLTNSFFLSSFYPSFLPSFLTCFISSSFSPFILLLLPFTKLSAYPSIYLSKYLYSPEYIQWNKLRLDKSLLFRSLSPLLFSPSWPSSTGSLSQLIWACPPNKTLESESARARGGREIWFIRLIWPDTKLLPNQKHTKTSSFPPLSLSLFFCLVLVVF